MYSLYRAWLSLGPPPPSPPPLNLSTTNQNNTPPDIVLQVGPGLVQFSAHRTVLATHSGYFKAALANYSELSPITVPNINVDEFSSLLTFMYTGYLDLNLNNIYNILLATHILHMPKALELCRNFLLQQQQNNSQPTVVIKPIPSRQLPTQQQFFLQPTTLTDLPKSDNTSFEVVPPKQMHDKCSEASTSKIEDNSKRIEKKEKIRMKRVNIKSLPSNSTIIPNNNNNNNSESDKVIIDIACCDGPVRFHRVINKNYGHQDLQQQQQQFLPPNKSNNNAIMNKIMNENIKQMTDENHSDNNSNTTTTTTATTTTTNQEMFTCLYCNHTFKSQYCYQKHARRHLNPVTIEPPTPTIKASKDVAVPRSGGGGNSASADSCNVKEMKREVRLLDMNVQYYPCKTCGSKFPSYYFVHKHRKLCHADELNNENQQNSDNNNNNNNRKDKSDDSDDSIDVEVVNADN